MNKDGGWTMQMAAVGGILMSCFINEISLRLTLPSVTVNTRFDRQVVGLAKPPAVVSYRGRFASDARVWLLHWIKSLHYIIIFNIFIYWVMISSNRWANIQMKWPNHWPTILCSESFIVQGIYT